VKIFNYLVLFIVLSFSVSAENSQIEIAHEFLSKYYKVQKLNELKKFLHSDMLKSVESTDEFFINMRRSSDTYIARWSNVNIKYLSSKVDADIFKIKFEVSGVTFNKPSSKTQTVYLKKDNGQWKIQALA
jgi:hypothetical protein